MKRLNPLLALWLVATFVAGVSAAQVPAGQTQYEVPGENTFPEGIAYHEERGELFVGGAMSGAIYRIDVATGEAQALVEAGARPPFATLGLAVEDDALWVAGGMSGTVARYDIATGALDATFETSPTDSTLINDLVVSPTGDVYATDSYRPTVFRIAAGSSEIEDWLDFDGTVFEYEEGVNANGIAVTDDGRFLIIVSLNTGDLYRIDTTTREVTQVDVEGGPFPGGDGLRLDGRTLYVAQQGADQVSVIELNDEYSAGSVERTITDDSFTQIATIAFVGDDLVAVNTQFGAMQDGPALPFTLSVISGAR
ncbi:MAG: SMP-30/gluconolactonase/LRE family protein [Trueperaceae bacterium]|nr:SMP-30/gluconolactonase/LRE family protein [Trueperaceae bacterium]